MRNSIKEELKNYLDNFIKDLRSDIDEIYDGQELHHKAFNEDYYIIGYYQAEQWLKNMMFQYLKQSTSFKTTSAKCSELMP
jgi:hypothetical protein